MVIDLYNELADVRDRLDNKDEISDEDLKEIEHLIEKFEDEYWRILGIN